METAMRVLSVPSTDGVVLQVQDRGVWYPPSAPSSSHLEGLRNYCLKTRFIWDT